MIAAVLCGISRLEEFPRSVCAMGHKWMWSEALGGLPPEDFLASVDPLFTGVRAKIAQGKYRKAGLPAGTLTVEWAKRLAFPLESRWRQARSTRTGMLWPRESS